MDQRDQRYMNLSKGISKLIIKMLTGQGVEP
jgi:hypothetical protein